MHRKVEQPEETRVKKRRKAQHPVRKWILRICAVMMTTLIIAGCGLYCLCYIVFCGPSKDARDRLALSAIGSSAVKWLPYWFLPDETVERIILDNEPKVTPAVTDPSLVVITPVDKRDSSDETDEWANAEDGMYLVNVGGATYRGYLLVIRDPSRVYLAAASDFKDESKPGLSVSKMYKRENCAAIINAGGFPDSGGMGDGNRPNSLTFAKGTLVYGSLTRKYDAFVGLTNDNILVVGSMTGREATDIGVRDGVAFGPALIINGQIQPFTSTSGGNAPRTAIGQRADGAILFLVVDGRQPGSVGATYLDLATAMEKYGAVNACNLDGGSSSYMIYNGDVINSSSSLYGQRKMPTYFAVAQVEG